MGKTGSTRDERLGDVGLVVLDEVHYLGDPWRGSVWEEAIINCPRHIQVGTVPCVCIGCCSSIFDICLSSLYKGAAQLYDTPKVVGGSMVVMGW